ncbi:hypothetical protein C7212DRAFT_324526 [Tuber magnatum]|uniref:Uncharacterized protein n=1 Tax=Tuber magnatum TaxID=42249 RepID=A0A317SP09_9PEZI|nr:hypothetical protein C7212DRAFT_324526 [Tuber magnatum]
MRPVSEIPKGKKTYARETLISYLVEGDWDSPEYPHQPAIPNGWALPRHDSTSTRTVNFAQVQ